MLKITRRNRSGADVETLIMVENINGVTEKKIEDTKLYDESGNLVSTQPNDSLFEVRFNNGDRIFITRETYNKLVTKLNVETL